MYFSGSAKRATSSESRKARAVRSREAMTIPQEELGNPAAEMEHGGGADDPAQRHGQEHLPAQPHQLVVAIAGQRSLGPAEDEQQERDLGAEPHEAWHPGEGRVRDRRHPAAE